MQIILTPMSDGSLQVAVRKPSRFQWGIPDVMSEYLPGSFLDDLEALTGQARAVFLEHQAQPANKNAAPLR